MHFSHHIWLISELVYSLSKHLFDLGDPELLYLLFYRKKDPLKQFDLGCLSPYFINE